MFNNKDKSTSKSSNSRSPFTTPIVAGGLGGTLFYGHRRLMNREGYRNKFYSMLDKVETQSPSQILRTFGLSELASSYIPDSVYVGADTLFNTSGSLSPFGSHLQRLVGDSADITKLGQAGGLNFVRGAGLRSPYLQLESDPNVRVRFTKEGRLSKSSSRYGAPLAEAEVERSANPKPLNRMWEDFRIFQKSQQPKGYQGGVGKIAGFDVKTGDLGDRAFQPYLADIKGKRISSLASRANRTIFELGERGQRLLSDVGLGLKAGSYNKLAHIPFIGEGGLINNLLTKRALPAYLAVGVALPFADYLTGHTVSGLGLDLLQKATVARAEVTDRTPGLRKLTDTYKDVVPGPQYGPLALPLAGILTGSALHYANVLRGKLPTSELREKSWRILAKDGDQTFLRYFNKKSPGAVGFAVGLLAMVPFIPGMLGSRKTAQEQRDIYSGATPVPIRSGRWWDLGTTAWEGGRIKEWRPHWSVLWRTQAEKKSLWGSEKSYWANNPILHPFKYLKNPYALEEQNYSDRPYPITSPAFSNVPLVGPLLAATIGKLVKPVKRMHTDVPTDEYTLYSSKLEPKGPQVESPFERQVLKKLAMAGYAADTQVGVDNYRLDFVVNGANGKRLAIEADGDSFHQGWNLIGDRERQANIEAKGWNIARIHSGVFADNPDAAMAPIFKQLNDMGIEPEEIGDRNVNTGLIGLAPPKPGEEFSLGSVVGSEAKIFSEFIGLPGFLGRSIYEGLFPDTKIGQETKLEGSRNIDSTARRYYDLELGAGLFLSPGGEQFGYSEPFRRFVQKESGIADVNEIPNNMPSWIPGSDYLVDLKVGDPYAKISTGYARLPGAGYEAIHPELQGLNPEDYPDITKLEILGDIAPYSREYNKYKSVVGYQADRDVQTKIRYDRVMDQVRQTRESVIKTDSRRFTEDIQEISGTIKQAGLGSFELNEYPNQVFTMSSVGSSAADLAALAIGEQNSRTAAQVGKNVTERLQKLSGLISNKLARGTKVSLTIPANTIDSNLSISAVVKTDGTNINQEIIDEGLGVYRKDLAGAETQAMFGTTSNLIGKYAETLAFSGDESFFNPLRYLPNPANTKLWQSREPVAQYVDQEVVGVRMRRWQRPIHDFIAPYLRGGVRRLTGDAIIPADVQERRDFNTLTDMLQYLRAEVQLGTGNNRLQYTNQVRRTAVGADQFGPTNFLASSLPDRDSNYFLRFLGETDPKKREEILAVVSPEMARSLTSQWVKNDALIASSRGANVPDIGSNGRLFTEEGLAAYNDADTDLNYGDYQRSQEIAEFFTNKGYNLPDIDSSVLDVNIDYEDVKLKIIQNEGYDYHDFNIFDDRAALLWRKPYIDGAVRELTSGDTRSVEDNRKMVEQILLASGNKDPKVKSFGTQSQRNSSQQSVNITLDSQDKVLKDMRRNPDKYS